MPLASALELVLNQYDIYDIDDLLAILRSSDDARQVADLIDRSRALIDATAGTAHVNVQTEPATATVGTTMESVVNVREVGSMATFSPTTGARMVSMEVQCSPARPLRWWSVLCKSKLQRCVMLQSVPRSARQMPVRATTWWSTSDCSSQHSSSQTEMPEQPEPEQPEQPEPEAEQPRDKPEPESHPEDSSSQPEQEKSGPEPQSKSPETEEELLLLSPPPVFADCSHYNATPMTSRRRERRRTRVSVW